MAYQSDTKAMQRSSKFTRLHALVLAFRGQRRGATVLPHLSAAENHFEDAQSRKRSNRKKRHT